MSGTYPFVVHYRLRGQPMTAEVEATSEAFTPEQARSHVESLHTGENTSDITDVTVTAGTPHGASKPGQKQAS